MTFTLWRSESPLPQSLRGAVVAIGNFDGLHPGHCAVLQRAQDEAATRGTLPAVLTFTPHPREYFAPGLKPWGLLPMAERLRGLREAGVRLVCLKRFHRDLAHRTAEQFVEDVLVRQLGASHVVTGGNFTFGRGREGNVARLRAMLAERGIGYDAIEPLSPDGAHYSSTRIRESLRAGDVKLAATLLGRPYETAATVIHGEKRGRELGYPTANLALSPRYWPRHGVYAVWARVGDEPQWRPAAASFGTRPTFGGQRLLLEVYLIDAPAGLDLYGKTLTVRWEGFLRGETYFPDAAALMRQMDQDIVDVRAMLRTQPEAA